MYLITKESKINFVKKYAGGKGLNLYLMSCAGLNIPEFCVIPPQAFEIFKNENKLNEKISELLSSQLSYSQIEKEIEELITTIEINNKSGVYEFLINATKRFDDELISVRSSALDEDSATNSFAGLLSSYLFIKGSDEVIKSIKKCWASAFSARSLSYRKENGIGHDQISISVVLQKMVFADSAGVMFTGNPINKKSNQTIINAVYGVGEGLVSGHLEGDNYVVDNGTGQIIEQNISLQKEIFTKDVNENQLVITTLDEHVGKESTLNDDQIKELYLMGEKIEDFYQAPQDIEWAFYKGELFILQSRPITTEVYSDHGTLFIWDNSNIVESYGGITKPLTFGFARYVYHQVYVQFCEILMVPTKEIRAMDDFLKNMLGLFYGRVYYNLLNWYRLTNILPGYKFNRKFMETMMGTDTSLADEVAERIRPRSYQNTLGAKVKKFLTGIKFFYFHLNIQNIVDTFLEEFYLYYNKYKKQNYAHMSASDIYKNYRSLEKDLLWRWHAPIINDFLCMVHFGLFQKFTQKWLSHLGNNFHNDLLAGNGNLESAEPTRRLIQIAAMIDKEPLIKELVINGDKNQLHEALRQNASKEINDAITDYLDRFGFRCMSEMKLEQIDLNQDPSLLFVFLKNLLNSGQTDLEKYEKREAQIRQSAEKKLHENISGPKKIIYKWSLKHARKAVMNRENTRFCRTRIYGIVRGMYYAIGDKFASAGLIEDGADVFYLTLEEMEGHFEGTNCVQNFKQIVVARKAEYARYEAMDEPNPRFMTRDMVYARNNHFPEPVTIDESNLAENEMAGLGCSPGVIEAIAKVILSPEDDLELNGEILVTYRTDPGWIPLYPSACGLLVERGGLLSHSAVVAREMGLPTIVSIKDLTKKIKTGDKIRFNGETGLIEILEENVQN